MSATQCLLTSSLFHPMQVWDYIYLGAEEPIDSPIPTELLQAGCFE